MPSPGRDSPLMFPGPGMEPIGPQGHPDPWPHTEGSSLMWEQSGEKLEGKTPLAKQRQPVSQEPHWVLHTLTSLSEWVIFRGGGQRGRAERQSRLSLGGAAAAGEVLGRAGGLSHSRCYMCSCPVLHLSPRSLSQAHPLHSPQAPVPAFPGEALCASLAGPSSGPSGCPRCFPQQPQPWQPQGAFAKEKLHGVPKAAVAAEAPSGSVGLWCACSLVPSPQ